VRVRNLGPLGAVRMKIVSHYRRTAGWCTIGAVFEALGAFGVPKPEYQEKCGPFSDVSARYIDRGRVWIRWRPNQSSRISQEEIHP
jgi:hypothetical protein